MTLQITIDGDELYDYVRIDALEETETKQVDRMLAASKREAEEYLNTDFSTTDDQGVVTPHEAPEEVKDWVFDRVAHRYENRGTLGKPDFTSIQSHRVYSFR